MRAQEKDLLKEITKIKRAKTEISGYATFQTNIDNMRATQDKLRATMSSQNAAISELKQAIDALLLASRLGLAPSDIVKATIEIPESELGYVIGRGGNTVSSKFPPF